MPIYGDALDEPMNYRQFRAIKEQVLDKLKLTPRQWINLLSDGVSSDGVLHNQVDTDGIVAVAGSVTEANSNTINTHMEVIKWGLEGFFGPWGTTAKDPGGIQAVGICSYADGGGIAADVIMSAPTTAAVRVLGVVTGCSTAAPSGAIGIASVQNGAFGADQLVHHPCNVDLGNAGIVVSAGGLAANDRYCVNVIYREEDP